MTINTFGIFHNDNEICYVDFIAVAARHADPYSEINFTKSNDRIKVVVRPSDDMFKQSIIDNLLEANRRLGKVIHFSKSLAIQKSVVYDLDIQ